MKSKLKKLVLVGAIGFTVATLAKRLQGGAGSDWQSSAGPLGTVAPPPPAPPAPPAVPEPEPEPAPETEPETEPAPAGKTPDPLSDPIDEVEAAAEQVDATAEVPVVTEPLVDDRPQG